MWMMQYDQMVYLYYYYVLIHLLLCIGDIFNIPLVYEFILYRCKR